MKMLQFSNNQTTYNKEGKIRRRKKGRRRRKKM